MKNKMAKKIILGSIALLAVLTGLTGFYYIHAEQQKKEEQRIKEGVDKKYIMLVVNGKYVDKYKKPEYNDKYWQEFLQDPYTAEGLKHINQYMEEVYPESPYIEVTVEDLEDHYSELNDLWYNQVSDYLYIETNGEYNCADTFLNAKYEGQNRDIINFLGYGELTEDYQYGDITYREIFLKEDSLGICLEKLNQYMKENYPQIEFEDITIDRLENEPYTDNKQLVYYQLNEVKKQLEAEGVNWETIVQQIHTQIE